MDAAERKRRWFHVTPDRLVIGLLVVECLLCVSNWLGWWHKGYAVLVSIAAVGAMLIAMLFWLIAALVFRRRFQFSLRTLLVLTVVVAIPCSWMTAEVKKAREKTEAVEAILRLSGGNVIALYDWQLDKFGHIRIPKPARPEPVRLRALLGDDFFANITQITAGDIEVTDAELQHIGWLTQLTDLTLDNSRITDTGLVHVTGLHKLKTLSLGDCEVTDIGLVRLVELCHLEVLDIEGTRVTDAGLSHLDRLPQLKSLSLDRTQITDAGLVHLGGLTKLEDLLLEGTKITDSGLEHIKTLKNLQWLDLGMTTIGDAGLKHLSGLTQLQTLNLDRTDVTNEGVKKLQRELPNCAIYH